MARGPDGFEPVRCCDEQQVEIAEIVNLILRTGSDQQESGCVGERPRGLDDLLESGGLAMPALPHHHR